MKFVLVLVALGLVACLAQDDESTAVSGNTCSEENANEFEKAYRNCLHKTSEAPRPASSEGEQKGRHGCHCTATDIECQERCIQTCQCMDDELTGKEFYETKKTTCDIQNCAYNTTMYDCIKRQLFIPCFSVLRDKYGGIQSNHIQSALYSLF